MLPLGRRAHGRRHDSAAGRSDRRALSVGSHGQDRYADATGHAGHDALDHGRDRTGCGSDAHTAGAVDRADDREGEAARRRGAAGFVPTRSAIRCSALQRAALCCTVVRWIEWARDRSDSLFTRVRALARVRPWDPPPPRVARERAAGVRVERERRCTSKATRANRVRVQIAKKVLYWNEQK